MTTQDLGRDLGHGVGQDQRPTSTEDRPDDALGALFESSPARPVTTSVAALAAFLLGSAALLGSPFSLLTGFCLGLAAVGLVTSVVGLARASRAGVSGGVLAAIGLVASLAAGAVIGLPYLGVDTTFGDALLPAMGDALRSLNSLMPTP